MNGCAGGFAAAPQGGAFQNCNGNFEIAHSIKEKVHSLLSFDIVDADKGISAELRDEIERDGVVIFEKAR